VALTTIGAEEFARRLSLAGQTTDERFVLFLGSGCSVSSGIPAARTLVSDYWLPRLRNLRAPRRTDVAEWAREEFPEYDPADPAALYGALIAQLFLTDGDRQREIEQLCDGKWPAYGYATIAALMAREGGAFSVALTTNFDDLISDALYLFTDARPLVIQHDSLAPFIRSTRTRPMVVKLHGDQRLSPRNTAEETQVLVRDIESRVHSLLQDRGLVFIGYGGRDASILKMLERLDPSALQHGVYWVGRPETPDSMRQWLESRGAIHVKSPDFDELMVLVRDQFQLPHPGRARFDAVFKRYADDYAEISARIASLSQTGDATPALKAAAERVDRSFPDWWSAYLEASRLAASDPERADAVFAAGLTQFPKSGPLMNTYAIFLKNIRKDYDRAEEMYKRAIAADPKQANNLGNYAIFLETIRKDHDRAEEMYKRSIEADPKHANGIGNYARFLKNIRKDYDRAEEMYKRSIEADPKQANNLGNYAIFLETIRKDYDRAEEMYKRAFEADPKHANSIGNLGGLLLGLGRQAEGVRLVREALALAGPEEGDLAPLAAECWFYLYANGPAEERTRAESNLRRLLARGVRSPGWDLSLNVEQARAQGHPGLGEVRQLAKVIGSDIGLGQA